MKTVPVFLGGFVPSRRPPLATTIGWRQLVRGCAICLAGVALLVLLTAIIGPRDAQTARAPELAAASPSSPLGKFGR